MKIVLQKLILVVSLTLMFWSVSSQCDFEGDLVIPDQSSISVDIIVSGAEQNILGINNCLKAVHLHFDHDFVSDLTVGLISPSGDSITLIGFDPSNQSSSTSLVLSWDIEFVNRDELSAMPDPDHDEVWDSYPFPLGWLAFTTFTGSYYPYDGGLEDFSGAVNGVWTVVLSDNVQFSDGDVFCIGLEFCDDEGVVAGTCSPVESDFSGVSVAACEGDESLLIDAEPSLSTAYDSTVYNYRQLLFEGDAYVGPISSFDFTGFPAGTYSICGVHYLTEDEVGIDAMPVDSTLQALASYLEETTTCAQLSSDCIEIEILPVPPVITDTRTICSGDTVWINGVDYTETGVYDILSEVMPCDSMSVLDLTVISLDVAISADVTAFDCDNSEITLSGEDSVIPSGASVSWTTTDGSFVSGTSSPVARIDAAGTYTFTVTRSGCSFSQEITIDEADDFLLYDFAVEDITCLRDSAMIDLTASDGIDSISWSSTSDFRMIGEDILVGVADTFSVFFRTEFGCEVSEEIIVRDIRVFPFFELQANTITCLEPEVRITTTPDIYNSTFTWISNQEVVGNGSSLLVDSAGRYDLRVTTAQGCRDTFSIDVESTLDVLDVEVVASDLGCEKVETEVAYISSFGGLIVLWTLPDMSTLVDSAFVTSLPGAYRLELEDDKGCMRDTTFMISQDNVTPSLEVMDAVFLCGVDSLQIFSDLTSTEPVSYNWSSAGGFADTSAVPWVYSPGEYYVQTCIANGCCDYDTFTVLADVEVPFLTFDFQDISCEADTVYIIPSDTVSYDLSWTLNDIPLVVDSNIVQVVNEGSYEVVALNPSNGCRSTFSIEIERDTITKINGLSANIINCTNDSVQIFVDSDRPFDSFAWSGPGLQNGGVQPFVNTEGTYVFDYVLDNGCADTDSITVMREGELPQLAGRDTVYNCFSSTLDLEVTYQASTISIVWEGPSFQGEGDRVTVSRPGTYNVYAVSPGACRDTVQIEVVADTITPVISIANDGIITCADTIVDIDLIIDMNTDSYTFSGPGIVSQNGTHIMVDQEGTYTAAATALNGCQKQASTIVMVSNDFPDYVPLLDSLDCANDEVIVGFTSPDPALDVEWVGPSVVAPDVYQFMTDQTGTYHFTLTNVDGCVSEDSLVIFLDTFPPKTEILLSNQITCGQDETTLSLSSVDPSWDVEWRGPGVIDPSASEFSTGAVGEYILSVTAGNGCLTTDTMTVLYDTTAADIVVQGDPITCTNGKVFLSVVADNQIIDYEWQGPNAFASDQAEPLVFEAGDYQVTVTSANGCTSNGTVTIEDIREYPTILVDDFYLPCDEAPAEVTFSSVSEGSLIRWFGPNGFFVSGDTANAFVAGQYVAVAFSAEGCATSDTFQVIDEAILPIFGADDNTLFCFGPEPLMAIDVEDDRSIEWRGPDGFVSQANPILRENPGLYTLIVTGTNGCVDSTTVELIDGRVYPEVAVQGNSLFQCENTEVTIGSEGTSSGDDFIYQWRTEGGNILAGANGPSPRIQSEGIYILRVTDVTIGCVTEDSLVLTLNDPDFTELELMVNPPSCTGYEDASINILSFVGGYGPYEVTVDGDLYGERMDILYLADGEHEVMVVDSLGCVVDSTVVVEMRNPLEVVLPRDTTLIFGQSLTVLADITLPADSIDQIIWTSNVPPCEGCNTFDFAPSGNMTVGVTVIDINGCEVYEEFRLTVNRPNNLPFPQIFSPNGDGRNDIFYMPMTTGLEVIDFIRVYDNWGGLLYEREMITPGDMSKGWDGTVNGARAEMAVYIVEAVVTLIDGSQVRYTGGLTLVR